jgi:hypothetical protein
VPAIPQLTAPKPDKTINKLKTKLKWQPEPCATHYRIQVRLETKRGTLFAKDKNITQPKFLLTALRRGETYVWRIRACNGSTCSKWSAWSTFHVALPKNK